MSRFPRFETRFSDRDDALERLAQFTPRAWADLILQRAESADRAITYPLGLDQDVTVRKYPDVLMPPWWDAHGPLKLVRGEYLIFPHTVKR